MTDYMRSVTASGVSQFNLPEVVDFWASQGVVDAAFGREFLNAKACTECDFFISHAWNAPNDWYSHFMRENRFDTYQYKKTVELHNLLAGLDSPKGVQDITAWVDKCCIPSHGGCLLPFGKAGRGTLRLRGVW